MTAIDSHFKFTAERIAKADAIVIAAGAGIGVDSGLPDFRGNDGFWNAYPALARRCPELSCRFESVVMNIMLPS
jgi:NAD-dependent SIR2 family protein deacetylase